MKFDTLTRAVLLALFLGTVPAPAVDKGDLIEAWRKKDRAVRDYGRALRKLKNPTAEDRARLKQEILAPADAEFAKTRGDYQREAVERINAKATAADKVTDRELDRGEAVAPAKPGDKAAEKARSPAAAKDAAAKDAAKAAAEKQKEAAAAKAPVERPGVPNMWERAPRRDVQLDGEGIPDVIIFGKEKAAEE